MGMLTVRNLPDNIHRALKIQAAEHGSSTEAYVREILAQAVMPEDAIRFGDALHAISKKSGLTNKDVDILEEILEKTRDKTPIKPWDFE